jgi:hypothetical protein
MPASLKRARESCESEQAATSNERPTKRARITLWIDRDQDPPSPLPLAHFLRRGIVPILPSRPHERFNWRSSTNIKLAEFHATARSTPASLKKLIESGRKNKGTTPGISFLSPGKPVVRYEYWPVFDECADENEWTPSWPKKPTPTAELMTQTERQEWYWHLHRASHISETIDFSVEEHLARNQEEVVPSPEHPAWLKTLLSQLEYDD